MHKRNLWKYDETMEMLYIMKKKNYPCQFSNKHNQNMHIFRLVESELMERGYSNKSAEQICVRWKNLKNIHQKVKRSNDKNEQDLFPFYAEMNELMEQRETKTAPADAIPEDPAASTVSNAAGKSEPEQTVESAGTRSTSCNINVPTEPTRMRVPKKRKSFVAASPLHRTMRPAPTKLETTLATSKQELSDEFYRTQKRLIDYEFNLYMKKEEELIGQLQEATRSMLEEYMDTFFSHLKQVVGSQGNSEQRYTYVECYEDNAEEVV